LEEGRENVKLREEEKEKGQEGGLTDLVAKRGQIFLGVKWYSPSRPTVCRSAGKKRGKGTRSGRSSTSHVIEMAASLWAAQEKGGKKGSRRKEREGRGPIQQRIF